jgi:transcriptional regulator with GAF, ATPase, and Fis domain/tetratricopeptide (TPR) repeat protein
MAEGEPAPRVDRVVERGDGAGEADVSRGLSARSAGPRVVVVDATALSSDAAADHVARLSAGVRAARVAAGGAGTAFPACVVAVVPAPARPVTAEAIRIDLPPLSEVEAARLLRSVLVEPPAAAVVSLLHRVAEGWPGRLLAEAAARFPDGRPRIGGESAGAPSPLDPGLLPPADRDLLVRLALEPFPVSAVDLVDPEAGEAAEEEAALSFRRLARFGWVVRDGDAAAVREPTRESLRAALDDRERRSIHRRLAGRATGLRRAYHRIAAADGDDLARVLREESAALATPTEADRTALLAWAYDRDPSALAPGEELALARGAVTEGRYDLAARLLGSGRGPGGGARSVVRAAWLRRTGRVGEAARLLESAVRRGGEAAAAARLDLADLALSRGDLEEAARRLARVDPAPAGLAARAAELRIRAALARGDLAEADREASDAAEGAETGHRLWSLRGAVHLRRGRFDAAIAAFERSAEAARSAGDRHGAAADAANLGSAMLEAGRVVEAVQRLRGAVVELSALGARRELPAALLNLANAHVRIGDGEGALRILAHLREATPARLWDGFEAWVAAIEADARRLLGDDRGASERLDRVLDAPSAERPGDALLAGFLRLERADLAVRAGDVATARRRVAEVPEGSGAWPLRVRRATVALRIETLEGVPSAGAAEALVRGLADWPSPRDRLVEWRALAALAGAARRAGRGPAARAAALRAAAAAKAYRREVEEMGFDPLAGDPEQRLVDGILAETAGPGGAGGGVAGAPEVRRLLAVQRRLSSERDPARLLDVILDALVEITGAERGLLLIRPRRGEGLVVRRFRNVAAGALAARDGGSISLSIAEQVARTGEPIVTLDARADDRFAASRSVHDLGLRTVMVLPLIARGRTLGVVYLDTRMREAPIPPGVQDAALDLAGQAAMALQTARLLRLLRRHRREIERLNRELQRRVEEQAVELRGLRETLEETLPPEVADPFPGIVGGSAAMRDLHHRMRRVADADLGVLILGESGTGKELVARALHRRGGRREGPFVTENCAAIPESLLESILFGHVRGAFTGADRDRPGLFVVADRGTLFLDEIGDMSLSLQSKLLRVLEDGEVRPVGGSVVRRVDVRILAASNRDLAAMVRDGTFREDLFYRLAVLTLRLPPLRERVEDVPALVAHFLRKHAPDRRVAFSPAALRRIASLPWPGNVRQLENVVVRTLVLADGDLIDAGDLDIEGGAAAARPDPDLAPDGNLDIRTHVEALERRLIARALEASGGNRTRAAALLGLSRFGLLKKLRRGEE